MQECPTEGESVGHFRQRSRIGGNLPENSIPKGTAGKQSKAVEIVKKFSREYFTKL